MPCTKSWLAPLILSGALDFVAVVIELAQIAATLLFLLAQVIRRPARCAR